MIGAILVGIAAVIAVTVLKPAPMPSPEEMAAAEPEAQQAEQARAERARAGLLRGLSQAALDEAALDRVGGQLQGLP